MFSLKTYLELQIFMGVTNLLMLNAGLEKIKIVQYPRDFPDELSKYYAVVHYPLFPFAHVPSLCTPPFICICLIDFYCLDS